MGTSVEVTVEQGTLRGEAGTDCRIWRGVPYAQPPVGELRWRAPQPPDSWVGTREATAVVPEAMQPGRNSAHMSEDCLYLSVCAPNDETPAGGWPVLFWIHGGGDVTGNSEQLGIGDVFAAQGIVVVKIQYRLGSFGFLNLGSIFGDSECDAGAAGMLDQLAALKWVNQNIAAFGGDPSRITIYGESAGAKAIGDILGSPMAKGLFSQAISSSGGADDVAVPAATEMVARRFLQKAGASDPDGLRALTAERVLAAQEAVIPSNQSVWVWRPTMHPQAAPQKPIDAIAAGSAVGVRCIIGNNGNEAIFFATVEGFANFEAPARANIEAILGSERTQVLLEQYQRSRGVEEAGALIAAAGDERYAIGTLREAEAQSAHGTVYRYRLDVNAPNYPPTLAGGHTNDLYMVWQTPGAAAAMPADSARQKLSRAMHQAWVSFVKTGVPQSDDLPPWPEFEPSRRATMILRDQSVVELDPRKEEREIWGETSWEYGTWWPLPTD